MRTENENLGFLNNGDCGVVFVGLALSVLSTALDNDFVLKDFQGLRGRFLTMA